MKKLLSCLLAAVCAATMCPAVCAAEGNQNFSEEQALLEEYAPRIYYSYLESYYPTSIEEMYKCAKVENGIVKYTKPLSKLVGNLKTAKNFAFYCEKSDGSVSLVYWQYYMMDPGKAMIGSHYGDWEHISIRLVDEDKDGVWTPETLLYRHHGQSETVDWDSRQLSKYGNHPIVYAANGSHGLWLSTGSHQYYEFPPLFDVTSKGKKWDSWNSLECYYKPATEDVSDLECIAGTDHTYELQTIEIWGQSSDSPDGPLDHGSVNNPYTFE